MTEGGQAAGFTTLSIATLQGIGSRWRGFAAAIMAFGIILSLLSVGSDLTIRYFRSREVSRMEEVFLFSRPRPGISSEGAGPLFALKLSTPIASWKDSLEYRAIVRPFRLLYALGAGIFSIVSGTYFLMLAAGKKGKALTPERLARLSWPMTKLVLIIAWHSLLWLPVLGVLVARAFPPPTPLALIAAEITAFLGFLLLFPRFAMAPPIFIESKKSDLRRCIEESYDRTEGYSFKILGNIFVLLILTGGGMFFLSWMYAPVRFSGADWLASIFLLSVGQQAMLATFAVFITKLAKSIADHPLEILADLSASRGKSGKAAIS